MVRPTGAGLPGPRPAPSWRRRLRAATTERLWLKGIAFLIALSLWAVVSLREPTEDVLPARVVPILGAGLELEGAPPTVRVLVRGMGRDVLKLHQTPPVIRRRIPANAPSEVTLELTPGSVTLPPGVEASVEEVMPRAVTLRLRRTAVSQAPLLQEDASIIVPPAVAAPRRGSPPAAARRSAGAGDARRDTLSPDSAVVDTTPPDTIRPDSLPPDSLRNDSPRNDSLPEDSSGARARPRPAGR